MSFTAEQAGQSAGTPVSLAAVLFALGNPDLMGLPQKAEQTVTSRAPESISHCNSGERGSLG